MLTLTDSEYVRFTDKVLIDKGCWLWLDAPNNYGYGQLRLTAGSRPMAHRIAYEQWVGPIPEDLWVLHRCDNPPCVRPDHLFLGTPKDNVHDMIAKGRRITNPGEANGQAKLTDVEVAEVRDLVRGGELQRVVADRFGITQGTVSRIINEKRRGMSAANRAARLLMIEGTTEA